MTEPPRLDASRLTRGPFLWVTPNRLVATCRVGVGFLLLVALVAGPDGLGSPTGRFLVAYGLTLLAIPAFARVGVLGIGTAVALLVAIRWAFSVPDGVTADALLSQLAGTVCAVVPSYARMLGQLAGLHEGHVSLQERRAMRRRRAGAPTWPSASESPAPPPGPAPQAVALLDYRPDAQQDAHPTPTH